MQTAKKILIIRFSSFGDIIQCLGPTKMLKEEYPQAQIEWVTKTEFGKLVLASPYVDGVREFHKKSGFVGLLKLIHELRRENYDLVYDAHANLRSFFLRWGLRLFSSVTVVKRPKSRWRRFLLFKLRKNTFEWPFRGMRSFLKPLQESDVLPYRVEDDLTQNLDLGGDVSQELVKAQVSIDRPYLALAPSAAWPMKRWPLDHWKKFVEIFEKQFPSVPIYILGGPQDNFCEEIAGVGEKTSNLAGKLSLLGSCEVIRHAGLVVSADTGLIHVADLIGVPGISLIGPTAFGFPTNPQIQVASVDLYCRPCTKDGRGKCIQDVYQKCMVDITPENVLRMTKKSFSAS